MANPSISPSSFTMHDVSKHSTEDDLWIVYDRKVYDISRFVRRHPGGWKILVENGGMEATQQMSGASHRHSQAALTMLNDYYIGDLREANGHQSTTKSNGHVTTNSKVEIDQFASSTEYARTKKRYDDLVNANHPLFWEIGKLGKSYIDWVFTPDDKNLRFFSSDFLESLTTCQWYIVPIVWLPIIVFFLHTSLSNFAVSGGKETWLPHLAGGVSVSVWMMPGLFVTGVLLWSLAEYIIHRWVFHLRPPHWSRVLITLHFLFHGQHHKNPMNRNRLVFPPVPAMPLAFVIWAIGTSLLPRATAQCVLAGVAFGYVIYDLIHYYIHHGTPSTSYFKDLKKYHVKHHYVYHELGFGISSKLWDYPFGTLIPDDNDSKKD